MLKINHTVLDYRCTNHLTTIKAEQPLADITSAGTLICPECGDDMELVGVRYVHTVSTAEEIAALPAGSVIVSGLPDTESNVAEKSWDDEGNWLLTGEGALFTSAELADWADDPFTVLRYGDDS